MIYNLTKYNSKWETLKLEQLGSFSRGVSKHRPRNDKILFENGKYPLVQTGDIKNANLYLEKYEKMYNDFGLKQSKLWDKDTLCITIAANIAETAILKFPMCFPDSVVGFIADKTRTTEVFMKYVFEYIKKAIQNSVSGSIQDNINIEYLQSLEFKIPNLKYQNKIVNILLNIDKKIINNNHISNNLEEMMKILYQRWFLEFEFPNEEGKPYKSSGGKMVWNEELKQEIPGDWVCKNVSQLANITWGQCPNGNNILPIDTTIEDTIDYCSGAGDMKGGFLVDCQAKTNDSKRYAHTGDILVSIAGKIGDMCYVDHDISLGRAAMAYTCDKKEYLEYLYYSLRMLNKKITTISTGSIQKVINSNHIKDLNIPFNESIVYKYSTIVRSAFNNIISNSQENKKLINLRDYLLPMLMNGQINVDDVKI